MTKKTAVKKKTTKKRRTKKAATKPAEAVATPPVTVPLDELYVYKLQLLTKNLEEAKAAIAKPLQEAFETELRKRIDAALAQDPAVLAANSTRIKCIDEVLEKLEGVLPEGYKVRVISPETATITAEFVPK